jgi:hypothetical protein
MVARLLPWSNACAARARVWWRPRVPRWQYTAAVPNSRIRQQHAQQQQQYTAVHRRAWPGARGGPCTWVDQWQVEHVSRSGTCLASTHTHMWTQKWTARAACGAIMLVGTARPSPMTRHLPSAQRRDCPPLPAT